MLSLIYVALQIRQNTEELRRAAFRNVYKGYSNIRRSIYTDTNLSSLIVKASNGPGNDLSDEEKFRLSNYLTEYLWTTTQLWLAKIAGELEYSEKAWDASVNSFLDEVDSIYFREYWEKFKDIYPEHFVSEINKHIARRGT